MMPATASSVQTVLGLIPSHRLGVTDAHTHVIRDSGVLTATSADFLLDSVDAAVAELMLFQSAGGGAIVDMMPAAPGRNARLLAEISARTGIHIVAATGFVPWALPADSPVWKCDESDLAQFLTTEIQQGIDAGNGSQAAVDRLPIRAGVIKVSLENEAPNESELKFMRAAALAHVATGAPISVHTLRGSGAIVLIDLLTSLGVPPSAILLAHCFHARDTALLHRIAATGAFLIADGAGKPHHDEDRLISDLLSLVQAGFGDRLLLALDSSRRQYWTSYGGSPGFDYLPRGLTERLLARGFTAADVEKLLIGNPAIAFAMRQL